MKAIKPISLYNTRTRRVDAFEPIEPGRVKIYSCGPTVYNFAHIGNLRAYVFVDTLKRALQWCGYQTNHVMNLTDVGHLTDDADQGDDKMEAAAKKTGKDIWDLSRFYSVRFFEHVGDLSIVPPDTVCRATDYIAEQIDLIKEIEAGGAAYTLEDGVYLDTAKVDDYAGFAKLSLEGQKEGARVETVEGKRNPTDFALWKFCEKGNRLMEWDSPWGSGFPGWHLECSAMSRKILGDQFDIHTGGIDHIPVHHTNEIAQMKAATGCSHWVNYWMHNNFIVLEKEKGDDGDTEKMSKSSGNFITLSTIRGWGVQPLAYRYFLLNTHYRKEARFMRSNIESASESLNRLWSNVKELTEDFNVSQLVSYQPTDKLNSHLKDLESAICDDLNTPKVLAALHVCLKDKNLVTGDKLYFTNEVDRLLGLRLLDGPVGKAKSLELDGMEKVIEMRAKARADKNFVVADTIRDVFAAIGIQFKDLPEGTTWEI